MRQIPLVLLLFVAIGCTPKPGASPSEESDLQESDGPTISMDLAGADLTLASDLADPKLWRDPYPPLPAKNEWPPGLSTQRTPMGIPIAVAMPEGNTDNAFVVLGSGGVTTFTPTDGAITIALMTDGTLGPRACPGPGMSGVPHQFTPAILRDVLVEAGRRVRFNHRRVFVEGNSGDAGWGVAAALDGPSQVYVTGVYVPWAEYNNAPCKGAMAPITPSPPRLLFISANQCDDTYCPLRSCIDLVKSLGYEVTFRDPLTPATCDCRGACNGSVPRSHFKGIGDPSPIRPFVQGLSR